MAVILFPDCKVLQLALASGAVPPDVAATPVRHGADATGRLWLEPGVPLPRASVSALRRFGALVQGSSPNPLTEEAPNWFLVLPLVPAASEPTDSPVLFELPRSELLLPLIAECRRLGAGTIGFRLAEERSSQRAFVQVTGAPLVSLLRGGSGAPNAPRAFVQSAQRVWVEWGFSHPLADRIAPPTGRLALLRAPRGFEFADDRPFEFGPDNLWPAGEPASIDRRADWPLTIDLKLVRSRDIQPPELWALKHDALAMLTAFVQQSDDRLLSRLSLALAGNGSSTVAILRSAPQRESPLVLMLPGANPFRQVWRLPNLFAPCGMTLNPPLRRDVVRARLAPDADRLVWLESDESGGMTAQSLPASAFRPLLEFVQYGVEFRPVACVVPEAPPMLPVTPYSVRSVRAAPPSRRVAAPSPPSKPAASPAGAGWMQKLVRWVTPLFARPDETSAEPRSPSIPELPAPLRPATHATDERRRALEMQLLAGEPNDAAQSSLWPELAGIYVAQGQFADAAACWLHALWSDEQPDRWVRGWLSAESRAKPEAALEHWLSSPPTPESIRALAAFLAWAAAQPTTTGIATALARSQFLIDAHEHWLPVRAAWLCRRALSRLAGEDAIGLMSCRDRLLARLFQNGLSAELDVPTFIRFAGQVSGERRQEARDWLLRVREPMHAWIAQPVSGGPLDVRLPQYGLGAIPRFNRAYVDLILAWGLARLGERSASEDLVVQARSGLDLGDPVHGFLADAYAYRLDQAISGATPAGPLSAELLTRLAELQARERNDEGERERQWIFKIERMRQSSRILEPEERVRAYEEGHLDRRMADGSELRVTTNPDELAERLTALLAAPPEQLARSLAVALDLAPRLGESFAIGALDRLVASVAQWDFHADGQLIDAELAAFERGWFVATRFDRSDIVRQLASALDRLLAAHGDPGADSATEDALLALLHQCLRGLRRLGLRSEADRLIHGLNRWAGNSAETAVALRRRLLYAAGLAYFGRDAQAGSTFADARQALFAGTVSPRERMKLACSYIEALGHGSGSAALPHIEEVFRMLQGVNDQLSTNSHFSLTRLRVVESAVLAVVNDDFVLGPTVRRWIDDDEFRIRKRLLTDTQKFTLVS